MFLVVVTLYAAGMAATWWLTAHVEAFALVCQDDRGAMAVVWPFTWLAALLVVLLVGIATIHARIARDDDDPAQ